jgi:hypothetical protein
MKNVKTIAAVLLAAAGLLLGPALAKADPITITLSSPFQVGGGGDALEFDATVTNNTADTVWLNSDSDTVEGLLTVDDSPFVNNFPLSLDPSGDPLDTATGWLFTVDIPSGTPVGLYAGTFTILGGSDPSDLSVLSSAPFDVQITPEPPSWQLMAIAIMGFLALVGWNSHRRQTAV